MAWPLRLSDLLRRPRALLLALLLLTAALLPFALRLRLTGGVASLLPRSSQAARTFQTFTEHLAAGQDLIVLVVVDQGAAAGLTPFADAYVEALRRSPLVEQVSHKVSREAVGYLREHLLLLLSEEDQAELARRLSPQALHAQARKLRSLLTMPGAGALAPLLTADPLELLPLLTRRLSAGLPVDASSGYFRSADGTALIIKVRPRFPPQDFARCQALLDDAAAAAQALGADVFTGVAPGSAAEARPGAAAAPRSIIRAQGARPTVAFTGSYAYPPHYRRLLEQDLSRSTTLSVVSVLLLFAVFFRALRILPVVLVPLCCAGVWTAALARLLLGELNAVSMAFGTILIAIGIDLPIQIYNRLREELQRAPDAPQQAVRATLDVLAAPALVATLGPALVFLSCALSDYRGLQQLGVLSALALVLNCAAMLLLLPALLLWLPPRLWWAGPAPASRARAPGLVARWLLLLQRVGPRGRRRVLLLGGALFLIAATLLVQRGGVGFEPQLLQLEPEGMAPAQTQAELALRFGDRQRFLVAVIEDADRERALDRADQWLRAAERLVAAGRLRGYEALGSLVPAPATQAARLLGLQRLGLPAAAERLAQALHDEGFAAEPFAPFLAQLRQLPTPLSLQALAQTELGFLVRSHLVDLPDRRLVSVNLFAPADERMPALLADLQAVAGGPAGGALTGLPLLERELLIIVQRDTLRVTAVALLLLLLLLGVTYRSWRPVAATLLPLLLAWVWFGAALSLCGLKLNLFNLLAVPLCIGYGIDDHVFLIDRFRRFRRARRSASVSGGAGELASLQGPAQAIVLTSLATIAGFGGLLVSRLSGLRQLGQTGALAVLFCLVAALLILPALLPALLPRSSNDEPGP